MSAQAALIDAVRAGAADLPGCQALFLAGSFGRGEADGSSDVDLLALAEPVDWGTLVAAWRPFVEAIMPVVHWAERRQPVPLVNAIGADWTRLDLSVLPTAALRGRAQDELVALYDPAGLHATLPPSRPPATPNPAVIAGAIAEFLRVLGLLPVVAARGEWVAASDGVGHLRRQFQTLLLEEVTLPDRGGALHLSRLLPPDRLALLAACRYPEPTRESVIAAHREAARLFLPVARALAARHGVAWPAAFEEATRHHLRATLGLEIGA